MNVMRVAIAGKDNEQFLGNAPDSQSLKAAVKPPGAALPSAGGSPAKPVKINALVKPTATPPMTGPAARPPTQPAAKPAAEPSPQPPAANPSAKPQVRPALPPQPAPANPGAAVKPALP